MPKSQDIPVAKLVSVDVILLAVTAMLYVHLFGNPLQIRSTEASQEDVPTASVEVMSSEVLPAE